MGARMLLPDISAMMRANKDGPAAVVGVVPDITSAVIIIGVGATAPAPKREKQT